MRKLVSLSFQIKPKLHYLSFRTEQSEVRNPFKSNLLRLKLKEKLNLEITISKVLLKGISRYRSKGQGGDSKGQGGDSKGQGGDSKGQKWKFEITKVEI